MVVERQFDPVRDLARGFSGLVMARQALDSGFSYGGGMTTVDLAEVVLQSLAAKRDSHTDNNKTGGQAVEALQPRPRITDPREVVRDFGRWLLELTEEPKASE